jgi:hypothetical protein
MTENETQPWHVALRLPHGDLLTVTMGGKPMAQHTRKAARHWCKKNWHRLLHSGMVLLAPDGTVEEFTPQS